MAYAAALDRTCGTGALDRVEPAYDCVARALAAYIRSREVSPYTSKFDYWQAGKATLTAAEARGFELFAGKAKCKNCHSTDPGSDGKPLFTNFGHQNTGVPRNPDLPYYRLSAALNPDGEKFVDRGLGDALRRAGLAEAAKEDGKFKTLREVVVFNNTRDVATWPAPEVRQNVHRHTSAAHSAHGHQHMPVEEGTFGRLGLTDQEADDIVAFLGTLTDGYRPSARSESEECIRSRRVS